MRISYTNIQVNRLQNCFFLSPDNSIKQRMRSEKVTEECEPLSNQAVKSAVLLLSGPVCTKLSVQMCPGGTVTLRGHIWMLLAHRPLCTVTLNSN